MTLQDKLTALKIPGKVTETTENAFYTVYKIAFNPDITYNKIKSREKDLEIFFNSKIDFSCDSGNVLLKVEKKTRQNIGLYDFTCEIKNGYKDYKIPLIIGLSEDGQKIIYDLVKCPHMLIAGSTGSGKSVFMHNLILSTFYTGVNLMLIDIKRVELSIYEGIPHLVNPVIYNPTEANKQLKNLCYEMDKRYKTLQSNKCRNIEEYQHKGGKMNYIVCFIDEIADLFMHDKRIEQNVIRLCQLGRACGIHLILATQRPDSNILNGLIRVNVPTRVCFAVQKSTDSRIILDCNGGEKLRGRGDGLFYPIGSKNPIRFQSPYITTEGIEKAVNIARNINN